MMNDFANNDATASHAGQFLSANDLGVMIVLLRELRELTQSRGTFAATNDLLERFDPALPEVMSELVHDSGLEQ